MGEITDKQYLKVSPTAYNLAFCRTLAQIKYAEEIYGELEKIKTSQSPEEIANLERRKMPQIAPMFEARYRLVNRLLEQNKTEQILEVAAGFSPRGIAMTAADPNLKYVELDLEAIVEEKQKIHDLLAAKGRIKASGNHFLEKGDALGESRLLDCTRHFGQKSVIVVNEGLMRYLSLKQKAQYARNVSAVLKKFGGVWITPDINLKNEIAFFRKEVVQISKDLGINTDINLFEDGAAAKKFFEDLGFTVEEHPFREIEKELIAPKKLGTTPEMLNHMLDRHMVYVMRLKP